MRAAQVVVVAVAVAALAASLLAAPAAASSIPIVDSDAAFPFLRNVDIPEEAMRWDTGKLIQLLSSCKLLRVTRRGVRCIAARHTLLKGWEHLFKEMGVPANGESASAACMPTSNALCMTHSGDRFFPTDTVFVSEAAVSRCTNGQGRTLVTDGLVADGRSNSSNRGNSSSSGSVPQQEAAAVLTHNDVSLCDILDTNLDVVYDPVNNRVFVVDLHDAAWLYVTISVLILIVVVLTAETVSQRERSSITHNIAAWVLLTVCSLLMLTRVDGRMHPFVTEEDHTFMLMCCFYVAVSTVFWVMTTHFYRHSVTRAEQGPQTDTQSGPHTQRDGINAMVGSIHLATTVLYGTPDNTYVSAFFFVLLFRCMQKLHDAHAHPEDWTVCANTMLVVDFTYTVLVFMFGVLPHFGHDDESILYAAAQYTICDMVAANCVISAAATTKTDGLKEETSSTQNGNNVQMTPAAANMNDPNPDANAS
jgi:hypothetical protein